jgi:hypothetical protein
MRLARSLLPFDPMALLYTLIMAKMNWNDSVNLLSKLTFTRIWNAVSVLSSYYISKWTKKPIQWGYPISILLSLPRPATFVALNAPAAYGHLPAPPACCKKTF